MRNFETGATRDTDEGKIDYWGFNSSIADELFGLYMLKHQRQADGSMRASDNWKKGIPLDAYQRSLYRHVQEFKRLIEIGANMDAIEVACAIRFNLNGWLHEIAKDMDPKDFPSLFMDPVSGDNLMPKADFRQMTRDVLGPEKGPSVRHTSEDRSLWRPMDRTERETWVLGRERPYPGDESVAQGGGSVLPSPTTGQAGGIAMQWRPEADKVIEPYPPEAPADTPLAATEPWPVPRTD